MALNPPPPLKAMRLCVAGVESHKPGKEWLGSQIGSKNPLYPFLLQKNINSSDCEGLLQVGIVALLRTELAVKPERQNATDI